MLSGHGRLLIIADDVWERQVLPTIRQALPADAHLLVTTRDSRVARAAGRALELDVLSQEDALALIREQFEQMPHDTARRLIQVVGAHPMALQIALGDMHPADPSDEWAEAVEKIAHKLAQGLGVDPTTLEDIDPEKRLSELIAISYQALTAHEPRQRCFRALGSLAPEASFTTAAVAAICDLSEKEGRDLLKVLRDRNLLRRLDGERWQQHTLLRSYALERQSQVERLTWAERHLAYYLEAMRAADDNQTYYTLAGDLPNLRHAFAWAIGEGRALGLAQSLLSNCANLLQSQNLGQEYLTWAEQARALAEKIGGQQEKGQALGSLGNALQNAVTLLYGPDRADRLKQALDAYDEALEKLRDVPLDYATTQNNRAVLLSDLASLPGENRADRLKQAVKEMSEAWPVLSSQAEHLLRIAQFTLAQLILAMGIEEFCTTWAGITDQSIPGLPGDLLLSTLANQAGITSQEAFLARINEDTAFKQQVDALVTFAGKRPAMSDANLTEAQALTDLLIGWIQTPDWAQSQAYLQEKAGTLLSDAAEAALALLQYSNPDNRAISQHLALLKRCRALDISQAYQEFHATLAAAQQAAQDPTGQALLALLQANSAEALEQALTQHPALLELPTLEQLAALVAEAADQPEVAYYLLARLGLLLEHYHHIHAEQVDLAEQAAFVALHEKLLPTAGMLDAELLAGLRRSLGWALNTLGNAYAGQGDHAAAVETYTRALAHTPDDAVLYRNRAGEWIELGQINQAQSDIEKATKLEPDATRLPELRKALREKIIADGIQEMTGEKDNE